MNTNVIGPQVWRLLDTWALAASRNPRLQPTFVAIMLTLRYVFPCRQCRESLQNYFSRKSVIESLKSDDPLTVIYNLHADVNNRTGRAHVNNFITLEIYRARLNVFTRTSSSDDVWDWFTYIFINLAQRVPKDIYFDGVLEHMRLVIAYAKSIGQIPSTKKIPTPVVQNPRQYLHCICQQYKNKQNVEDHINNMKGGIADMIIFSEPERLDRQFFLE